MPESWVDSDAVAVHLQMTSVVSRLCWAAWTTEQPQSSHLPKGSQ